MFNKSKEIISEKLNDLFRYETRFNGNPSLPGRDYLNNLKQYCVEMKNKRDPNEFYQYCDKNLNQILYAVEDFETIVNFFNGSQINIFEKAQLILQSIDANQAFINEQRVFEISNEIERLITSTTILNNIPQLSLLNNEYEGIASDLLKNTKYRVKNAIELYQKSTIDELNNEDELVILYADVIKKKFDDLLAKLENSLTLLDANHVDTEARQTQTNLSNTINAMRIQLATQNEDDDNPNEDDVPVVVKNVYIRDLFTGTNKAISNKEELNDLLDSLKEKLESELDQGNIVNITIQ